MIRTTASDIDGANRPNHADLAALKGSVMRLIRTKGSTLSQVISGRPGSNNRQWYAKAGKIDSATPDRSRAPMQAQGPAKHVVNVNANSWSPDFAVLEISAKKTRLVAAITNGTM